MFNLLLQLAFFAISVKALPTVSVKGAKFFAGGEQWFIKGVAYQGTPSDPLVDGTQCALDAASMSSIGVNCIRVYHVDPHANHDACMSAFASAGIYTLIDLDTFSTTIQQTAPEWTQAQFLAFSDVADEFQKYENVAGFFIGNEVINTLSGSAAAPYVKAATADMKAYLAMKKYRNIPIGYSAADIAELRPALQNYLTCGSSPEASIDFFGLNAYEWCGDVTYQTSGYANLQAMAQGYNVPLFFSETGCNTARPRTFTDQGAIFGPEMVDTWSGSIIYSWVQEANDYGLVTYPNGEIYSGAPIPIQPDYDNLSKEWATIKPAGIKEADYTPKLAAPACPGASGGWAVNGDVPLPTLGQGAVQAAAQSDRPTLAPAPTPSYPPVTVESQRLGTTSSAASTTSASSGSGSGVAKTTSSAQSQATNTSPEKTKNGGAALAMPGLLSLVAGCAVLACYS